ncbi:MAG: M23 family metallopeptidase [Anaerolineales bacterium]
MAGIINIVPRRCLFLILLGILLGMLLSLRLWRLFSPRSRWVLEWLRRPQAHPEWHSRALTRCGDAPFLFPTDGFIGYLWDDSFRLGHRHQGIDIFGGTEPGETPVYAAYDGYLTRLPGWKSSLILRVPNDPLQPGRQIWLYYTHMADPQGNSFILPDFPAGTSEHFVRAGSLLGYQGNYSTDPLNPVGVHLHFSIVLDDGQGHFRNELDIRNTLDPSPYFGLALNGRLNRDQIVVCGK